MKTGTTSQVRIRKRFAPNTSGWIAGCILPLLILGLSYLRIWGDAGSAAFDGKILEAALATPVWETALGLNIALFALAQITVYLILGFLCIALGMLADFAWRSAACSQRAWILLWSFATTAWVLIANATWFPASSLGSPYADLAAASWQGVDMLGIATVALLTTVTATTLRALTRIEFRSIALPLRKTAPVAGLLLAVSSVALLRPVTESQAAPQQPNVILIGLDSLRFDAVQHGRTPAISRFLEESTLFSDATTPLARTFPAWVSLLSGRHPHTTGATTNLLPRELIHTGQTLPQLLKTAGYRSLYAIDEVRFSNLDTSYGFDRMIAPRIGASDFVLGFFADTPLSNVLVNTRLGSVLFPYAYANRAAFLTYDPDTFVHRVASELQGDQPLFLATHFTLGHWPYVWAGTEGPRSSNFAEAYAAAIIRLDQQFANFMAELEQRGLLQNAIVVVLSDHGESVGPEHDEVSASFPADVALDTSQVLGHGTSVFAAEQYHVVLGMRSFGQTPLTGMLRKATIAAPVSLEDVTPTLADALALRADSPFDGFSLLPLLQAAPPHADRFASRVRFTETEFNPAGISLGAASTSALRTAASYYQVDPITDRVTIRPEDVQLVVSKRQYAAFRNGKMLAAFPPADPSKTGLRLAYMPAGRPPELVATSSSLAAHEEAAQLWSALQQRYPDLHRRVVFPGAPQGTDTGG